MSWMDDYDNAGGWKGHSANTSGTYSGKSQAKNWKRCWEDNHKPLEIGGGTVLGAACAFPADGYDIYIGFDHGMKFKHTAFPWEQETDPAIEFLWPITDMCAPKSPKEFKKMINWLQLQLLEGKKVHMGCIGGHGRTGLVLAALVAQCDGEKDAIQWVRKHHCKKGVESTSQVKFLVKHFGVKTAKPTKDYSQDAQKSSKGQKGGKGTNTIRTIGGNANVQAVKSSGSVW